MGRSIGIDLGTTNSVGAFVNDKGQAAIIDSRDQGRYTPSVVSVRRRKQASGEEQEDILIGRQAQNNAKAASKDTIYSFKRLMGRGLEDEKVKAARQRLTYEICSGAADDHRAHVLLGGRKLAPEDLSALVLRQIREDAECVFGQGEVTHAVITVPAYFEERQREATRRAGTLAGLCVKMILDEPVAAAIAHGSSAGDGPPRRLLVLDLGGGTFDISIVQQAGSKYQVLQTGGDMWLGGDDFDKAVVSIIEQKMREKGFPVPEDTRSRFELRVAAEVAKRGFASRPTVDVFLSGIRGREKLAEFDCEISRAEFERAVEPYLTRIEQLISDLLKQQSMRPELFDYALLVGGSSTLPQFKQAVRRVFGDRIRSIEDPMECVARGAALLAHSLAGIRCINEKCTAPDNSEEAESCRSCGTSLASARPVFQDHGPISVIMTPIPRALGVGCREGENLDSYHVLIPQGTLYPMDKPKEYTFRAGAAESLVLPIYEGSDSRASRNLLQGRVELKPPQQLKPGDPVVVGLNYTRNRTLNITLRYPTLGLHDNFYLSSVPAHTLHATDQDWSDKLGKQVQFVQRFLANYAQYISDSQRRRLEDYLSRAESAVFAADEKERQQLVSALHETVWEGFGEGFGVASAMYAAEIMRANAAPTVAAEMERLTDELRRAYAGADRSGQARLLSQLRSAIIREVEERTALRDKITLGGLLEKISAAGKK